MLNNYQQIRPTAQHDNAQRYFGKDLFNYQPDVNEQKVNHFQPQSVNIPLSQRQDTVEPLNSVYLPKRVGISSTHSQNSSFCAGFQAKQLKLNIQRQGTKDEKENSSLKMKQQTDSCKMVTESEDLDLTHNFSSINTMLEERQFSSVELENEIQQFDVSKLNDPQYTTIYISEIFNYLKGQEIKYGLDKIYMTPQQQPDINGKMRAILVDWLVDVHLKFKLKDETLYVTVALIDRYLACTQTSRQQLQLVGVASLFIACKYEEIYPPDLKDFVYITDNAYSKAEVLDMEGKILQALSFNITQPSSYSFLQRYGRIAELDKKNLLLAQYLIELSLVDLKFIIYKPSILVCSVIYLVHKIRKQNDPWNISLQQLTNYKETELRPCAKELCVLLQSIEKQTLQAVRKKFSTAKFLEVSRIKVERQTK